MIRFVILIFIGMEIHSSMAYERECDIIGSCINSPILDVISTVSKQQCRDHCKDMVECAWYVLNQEDKLCLTFASCPEISTEHCPTCLTNPENCVECEIEGLCVVSTKR